MGYDPTINANFQQAMNTVPYYAQQDATRVTQAQQAPIGFAAGEQQMTAPEKEGGLSLGKVLLGAAAVVGGIAAHKSYKVSQALTEAGVKEGASLGNLFKKFINPTSWFGNEAAAKTLIEKNGFKLLEEGKGANRHLVQKGDDVFILTGGKKLFNAKGEAFDDVENILKKVDDVKPSKENKGFFKSLGEVEKNEAKRILYSSEVNKMSSESLKQEKLITVNMAPEKDKKFYERVYDIAIHKATKREAGITTNVTKTELDPRTALFEKMQNAKKEFKTQTDPKIKAKAKKEYEAYKDQLIKLKNENKKAPIETTTVDVNQIKLDIDSKKTKLSQMNDELNKIRNKNSAKYIKLRQESLDLNQAIIKLEKKLS